MLWSHRESEIILNFPVIYTVVGSIIHTQLLESAKIPNSCHVQRNWITHEKKPLTDL